MKKFQFSIEKLRRYQQQKLRLAELEIQRARMVFDQSIAELHSIRRKFDDIAQARFEDMGKEQYLTNACQDVMHQLELEIQQAISAVKENEFRLQELAKIGTQERIKSESYEVLRTTEKSEHEIETAKSEMLELSETIMRTWSEKQGESGS